MFNASDNDIIHLQRNRGFFEVENLARWHKVVSYTKIQNRHPVQTILKTKQAYEICIIISCVFCLSEGGASYEDRQTKDQVIIS